MKFSADITYTANLTVLFTTNFQEELKRGIGAAAGKLPAHRGVNFFIRKGKDLEERFIGNAYMFTPEERKKLLKIKTNAPDPTEITKPFYDKVKNKDDVTKMQYL